MLARVRSVFQILLAIAVFTFFIFNPQEPISKFSGSLFDSNDSMRDQRNPRATLQEKHKLAMKGKTLVGSNAKGQPPVSAAGSFPRESGRIAEELRVLDVPQPPLKVWSCCMGWACCWGALHVCGAVPLSVGNSSWLRQFIKDAEKGGHCMADVMSLTFRRVS